MPTISEMLSSGAAMLADAGVSDARRDALTLLALGLGRDRAFLYAHPEYRLQADEFGRVQKFLDRRAEREPLQYIRGTQEFYGLEFEITRDVLIPRPETEMLVERVIALLKDVESARFIDIGTGSGCIPISILDNVPNARAIAVDISPSAIAVARRNAEKLGVSERLELIRSDVFENVPSVEFDVVVSNPPYVPIEDFSGLQPEVRDFEPAVALTDGGGGLAIVAKIVDGAPAYLRPGGTLLVEFGFGQHEKVREFLSSPSWESVSIEADLQGIPRVLIAKCGGD